MKNRQGQASSSEIQKLLVEESIWRAYWPFVTTTIMGVFMLIFGLAVAGLEAASIDKLSDISTTDLSVSSSSASRCGKSGSFDIGVGIWTGAIIAVAAVVILIINCGSSVKHWVHTSVGLVASAAVFSVVNFSINSKVIRVGVVTGGFKSSDPTRYRLAAAQVPAASLSFITCCAFLLLYLIVGMIMIPRAVKRQNPPGVPRQII